MQIVEYLILFLVDSRNSADAAPRLAVRRRHVEPV